MSERRLRLGVAGMGRAFSLMLPTFAGHPLIEVVAGADDRAEARERFAHDFSANVHRTVAELCADPAVEVVYISTPHQFHAEHVRMATANGKHVLVEKPMALGLQDCQNMIDCARRAGVQMIIGHSHSFDGPIRRTREIVESGAFGRLRMISAINYTDFLYRPRRPEELATATGGGALFNQAPHHIDVIRFITGGRVRSVRAGTGHWDPSRPTEGAYSAFLTFEDGAFASLTYSGYAHFDSDELCGWIGESGQPKDATRYGAARKRLARAGTGADEIKLKSALNYGGDAYVGPQTSAADGGAPFHQHFGLIVATCDRADLRPTPQGVVIYEDTAERLETLPVPKVPRSEVIAELYDAIVHRRPPLHDGAWGRATMEVCLAMLRSAREQREILLEHQVALPSITTETP
jgi:phthalate 4,5-cis-dihydrodiol dehydrogenase